MWVIFTKFPKTSFIAIWQLLFTSHYLSLSHVNYYCPDLPQYNMVIELKMIKLYS